MHYLRTDVLLNFRVAADRSSVVLYIVRVSISTWPSKAKSFKMSMESALIYMEIPWITLNTLNTHVFPIWLTSSPKNKLEGKRFWNGKKTIICMY